MGEKITFRPRGRGCCVGSGVSASITEPRVKFKKGWLTGGTDPADGSVEVGDGTDYPMVITLDEMCEIFYRVRDAWFTSGSVDYSGGGVATAIVGTPSLTRLVDSFDTGDFEYERGYWTNTATNLLYHGTKYDGNYQDADSELAMFNEPYNYSAFEHYLFVDYDLVNPTYGLSVGAGTHELRVSSSARVAYVGGDDPYDPTVTLYLNIGFSLFGDSFRALESNKTTLGSMELAGIDLIFELSNSNVSCPLYTPTGEVEAGDTDFILTSKEWWPYAHANGSPVWNRFTGEYLPTFTPASYEFNNPNNTNIIPIL